MEILTVAMNFYVSMWNAMDFAFLVNPFYWLWIVALAVVAYCQNMAFTAVSRSRNSGDPLYHRKCAWMSNGIWLACYLMVWHKVWGAFESSNYVEMVPMFIVYVLATAEGSVKMMKILLAKEEGKKRVGARGDEKGLRTLIETMQKEIATLSSKAALLGDNT